MKKVGIVGARKYTNKRKIVGGVIIGINQSYVIRME